MRSFDVPLEKIKKIKEAIGSDSIPLRALCHELGIGEADKGQIPETRLSSLTSMVILTILFRSRFVVIVTRSGEVRSMNLDASEQSMGFFYRHDLADDKEVVPELMDLIWRRGYQKITWASKDGRITYFDCPHRFLLNSELPGGGSFDL